MFHGLFDPPLATGWQKDIIGYLAGALVVCTFSFRSMHLLRYAGIASNVSFIAYAVLAGTMPILVLHSLLLPINVFRLIQIERNRPAVKLDVGHMVSPQLNPNARPDGTALSSTGSAAAFVASGSARSFSTWIIAIGMILVSAAYWMRSQSGSGKTEASRRACSGADQQAKSAACVWRD